MKQITEVEFMSVVEKLKKANDFKEFVENVQKRIDDLLKNPRFNYSVKTKDGKKKIIEFDINDGLNAREKKYKKILDSVSNVGKIMFLKPSELERMVKALKVLELNENDIIDRSFSHLLQDKLRYSYLRSGGERLLYTLYKHLGVKSCIYCNSQHTILLSDEQKTMRLQADHYIAKSKYPTFSITLANLYPACNNCNHLKNDKELLYSLYYDDKKTKHHDLGFQITPDSLNKYYLHRSSNNAEGHLNIKFKDYYNNDINNSSKLNDVLKIEKIYENHRDIVADLINKKIVYKASYLGALTKEFEKLFQREEGTVNHYLINQMIYGHSLKEGDINKRVFSKITIDIKKQLDSFDLEKSR